MTAQVIAAGRLVNVFKMKLTCAQGGDLTVQAGPPAGEFISASGAFEGWGYAHWKGRFGRGGTLTGTFRSADPCGQSDQLDGTFTATRASARAPSTR